MERKAMLGHKVRRLRRENRLTQAQMAETLAISPSYLNLIESNQRPLTVPLLLLVTTRRVRKGEALLFEGDTAFWRAPAQSSKAASDEPRTEQPGEQEQELPATQPFEETQPGDAGAADAAALLDQSEIRTLVV